MVQVHEQHREEIALFRASEIDSPAIAADRLQRTKDAEPRPRVRPIVGAVC
jgi:hypothetical protein